MRITAKIVLSLIVVSIVAGLLLPAPREGDYKRVNRGVQIHGPSFTGSVKVSGVLRNYEAVFSGDVESSNHRSVQSYVYRSDSGDVQVLECISDPLGIDKVRSDMMDRIDDSVDRLATYEEPSGDSRSYVDAERMKTAIRFSYKGIDCLILQENDYRFLTMLAKGDASEGFIDSFRLTQ